jgi:hypothetical protein
MEVPKEILKEIVDNLDMGFRVFLNTKTFEIVSFPNEDEAFDFDAKAWKAEIKKVKNKKDYFIEIEKPGSRESYKIMEDFIYSISDTKLVEKLTQAIEGRKPFANFKFQIDQSGPFREKWFAFKENQLLDYVQHQLDVERL